MEIKRKFEVLLATKRRYVISQSPTDEKISCAECGEETLTAEQTANLFGITQREIFGLIEKKAVHFTEIEAGKVMICLTSLAAVLDAKSESSKN